MSLALVAAAVVSTARLAQAGCVIAPDGKSINVVTDNPANEEKTCAVKCQVDTKIGVVQVACGGNAPPLARDHSLCGFDKPEPWYRKVVSSEDSCQKQAGLMPPPAPPVTAAPAPANGKGFACRISPDGRTVDAMIANPFKRETSCQVNCQVSTTKPGTTVQVSCTKTVQPGVGEVVLCSNSTDSGTLVKMTGGSGQCINPEPPADSADKDDDADVEQLANDPAKMLERARKQLPPGTQLPSGVQEMLDKAQKQ